MTNHKFYLTLIQLDVMNDEFGLSKFKFKVAGNGVIKTCRHFFVIGLKGVGHMSVIPVYAANR